MRASDSERERVAERLREAVAEGRLDMEEFEQRLEAAYTARTHGELAPLVRDLPPSGTIAPVGAPAPAPASGRWAERIGRPATSKGAFAFWGGFGRKGTWTIGRRFTAFTLMGGGEIDLREARFEDRETVITCVAVMGGVQVVVPPDLNVEVRGIGLMGGFGEHGSVDGEPDPSAPRVIVNGVALMGGVGVERKRTRAERQRLKAEKAENAERARLEKRERSGRNDGDGRKELG
ncbi:DUF1707 and DUF2154 domain-containing protein [Streptomyces sp. ISL-10]|uniref:DUF1707 SHOCT-like domain-containing protein n=1 Tax=Streptomyces sp. ISL-10 TaxID=2819172 RepID=UPI001BE86F3C|nr:DUF1707 domain-containing protein [Streptomyces sp. ISL-10]MBT2367001.1 DUF1707 and DUF2154 domain-containing protein [Streptomyces sp. ISL-10]